MPPGIPSTRFETRPLQQDTNILAKASNKEYYVVRSTKYHFHHSGYFTVYSLDTFVSQASAGGPITTSSMPA